MKTRGYAMALMTLPLHNGMLSKVTTTALATIPAALLIVAIITGLNTSWWSRVMTDIISEALTRVMHLRVKVALLIWEVMWP